MRSLTLLTGTFFFLVGISLFMRGPAWDFGYMAAGTIFGMLGLFILGLSTDAATDSADRTGEAKSPKSRSRLRSRPSTGIRSLRMRRGQASAGGGR